VAYNIHPLSSLISPKMTTNLGGVSFKQFSRTFPGGYNINFIKCLSASNDFKVKNYSNFYLTDSYKISDVFDVDSSIIKSAFIYGPISIGTELLEFSDISSTPYGNINRYQEHFNYGYPKFTTTPSEKTNFTIELLDDNNCRIFYTKKYKKYYLCVDNDENVVFVKDILLSFSLTSINPQDFTYIYSKTNNSVIFFKKTAYNQLSISKSGNTLVTIPVIDNNIFTYASNSFIISKDIYIDPNISLDTSFITYDQTNNIDLSKSQLDLSNNMLLHRTYDTSSNDSLDIIVLKNQLLTNDTFASANNLLSGSNYASYADGMREYVSIGDDIKEETSEDLTLNYVFYNTSYTINPGTNIFRTPTSMYPFDGININDTKIMESGSFSYLTPEYADKVYQLSDDTKNYNNGQHLLCTWLSGSPTSNEKIWVDRYYYPDLIDKKEALQSKSIFNYTYTDYIESIIENNINIQDSISVSKIFDKRSDLVFVPNQNYRYERIDISDFPKIQSSFDYCNTYDELYPNNYFKQINESGQLTLGFNFSGDLENWVVKSDRNAINSGITITKELDTIRLDVNLYNYTDDVYDDINDMYNISIPTSISTLKDNFVCVSIDTKSGIGYFYLNNTVISTFQLPEYQFLNKQLLYGDFFQLIGDSKLDLLSGLTIFNNIFITDYFVESDLVFSISILNGSNTVDTINITLPCGMRNSIDDIDLLQTVCGNSAFKSNNINIHVKNLNISNTNVLDGLKEFIKNSIKTSLPASTIINNIEFQNYK
jgi:hypothetical protein